MGPDIKRRMTWRFIARRWWRCRKNGHALRRFNHHTYQFDECFCGLVYKPVRSRSEEATDA